MERGKLYIEEKENGKPEIVFKPVNGTVWLSSWEISKLLGTYSVAISNHLRAMFKSGVLYEKECSYCFRYSDGGSVDLYNFETVLALAFRIHSPNADLFKKWALEQIVKKKAKIEPVIILNTKMPIWMN
jgi:hypothetical protein